MGYGLRALVECNGINLGVLRRVSISGVGLVGRSIVSKGAVDIG